MHKAFGISLQECLDMRCESNKIVLNIRTPSDKLCCPECGSHNVVRNGFTARRFVSVPIGCSKTFVEMKIQRVKCMSILQKASAGIRPLSPIWL